MSYFKLTFQVQAQTFQTLQTKIHLHLVDSMKKIVGLSQIIYKESILTPLNFSMVIFGKNFMQFITFYGHLVALLFMEIFQKGKYAHFPLRILDKITKPINKTLVGAKDILQEIQIKALDGVGRSSILNPNTFCMKLQIEWHRMHHHKRSHYFY